MAKLCDLQIHVNSQQIFFLNQKVVSRYCAGLKKILDQRRRRSAHQISNLEIEVDDLPGGPDGFELVSIFCYNNGRIPITVSNVGLLHCCALHLGMDNLLRQTEAFLEGIYYWKWNDLLASLQSCDLFHDYAESCALLDKLICALLAKIAQNSYMNPLSTSSSSSSSSPDSTIRSTLPTKAWWFQDLGHLPPQIIEKLVRYLAAYKTNNTNLMLTRFLLHYLRTSTQTRGKDRNGFAGLAETAAHGVILVSKKAFSCRGLLRVLRIVSRFGLGRECRMELEKLIGGMLDQATLDDLLVSGHGMGVYYDVNLVIRLVRGFVEINGSESDDGLSLLKLKKVGRLIDNYLREISPDQNLKISKFLGVAECLPNCARDCFDGVYRAIDTYIESHPRVGFEERSTLCRCLDYKKLSFEASKDVAKNPRIPPRIAMQALIAQQSKQDSSEQDMRLDLERMQCRVVELENLCREINGQMSTLLNIHPSRIRAVPRFC